MNHESSTNTGFGHGDAAVIKPWQSGGLVDALVAFLVSGAVLVIMSSRFDDAKRQAQEAEAGIAKVRTELSSLQAEVNSLTNQKNQLATFDQRAAELKTLQTTAQQEEQKLATFQQQLSSQRDAARTLLSGNA